MFKGFILLRERLFLSIIALIIILEFFLTKYNGLRDFVYYYHVSEMILEGNFAIYSLSNWESYANVFFYLPASIILFIPLGFFEIELSFYIWRIVLLGIELSNVFLLHIILEKRVKEFRLKAIGLLIYAIAIAHVYNWICSARNPLILFLFFIAIIRNRNDLKNSFLVLLGVSLLPTYGFVYILYLLFNKKLILKNILLFLSTNFLLLFNLSDYLQNVILLKSSVNEIDWYIYSVLGSFFVLFQLDFTYTMFVSIIFIGLSYFGLYLYFSKKKENLSLTNILIFNSFMQILFNVTTEAYHVLIYLPFLIIYSLERIDNIYSYLRLVACFLISIPIPSSFLIFPILQILKRSLGYILFLGKNRSKYDFTT